MEESLISNRDRLRHTDLGRRIMISDDVRHAKSPLGTFLFVPNGRSATRQQRLIYALARHLSIQMFEVVETIVAVVRESSRR